VVRGPDPRLGYAIRDVQLDDRGRVYTGLNYRPLPVYPRPSVDTTMSPERRALQVMRQTLAEAGLGHNLSSDNSWMDERLFGVVRPTVGVPVDEQAVQADRNKLMELANSPEYVGEWKFELSSEKGRYLKTHDEGRLVRRTENGEVSNLVVLNVSSVWRKSPERGVTRRFTPQHRPRRVMNSDGHAFRPATAYRSNSSCPT
jgi:hypothetical protein